MIYQQLDQLADNYAHIYLSPHLDDAALSCGGAIAAQQAAGEPVLVVTLCTAAPPSSGPFSDLALAFHQEWGLAPEQVVAARLQEDRAAIDILAADSFWAGMLDAIYRQPTAYTSRETLFAAPTPADPLLPALRRLISELRLRMPGATFYAPLGVGAHVDHQLTCLAALEEIGERLYFYEDIPYVLRTGALEQRTAQLGLSLDVELRVISATLDRKIAAVLAYTSQMAELAHSQLGRPAAPDEAGTLMATALRNYAYAIGEGGEAAERVYSLPAQRG